MVRKWKRGILFLLLAAALAGCAIKPPVQEMSEARSAIDAAKQMHPARPEARRVLKSAEQSLQEAAEAIDHEHYALARSKALEAKRKAQQAAQMQSH